MAVTLVAGPSVDGTSATQSSFSWSHSGINSGSAPQDCTAIAILQYLAAAKRTLSSVTINSTAMATPVKQSVTFFAQMGLAIAVLDISASDSLAMTANFSGNILYCDCALFLFDDISSTTPTDTFDQAYSSGKTSYNIDMDTAVGSLVIGAETLYTGSGIPVSWSGITESYDQDTASGTGRKSGGYHVATSAETPRTIQMTWSGSQSVRGAGAVFPGVTNTTANESISFGVSAGLSETNAAIAYAAATLGAIGGLSAAAQAAIAETLTLAAAAGAGITSIATVFDSATFAALGGLTAAGGISVDDAVSLAVAQQIVAAGAQQIEQAITLAALADYAATITVTAEAAVTIDASLSLAATNTAVVVDAVTLAASAGLSTAAGALSEASIDLGLSVDLATIMQLAAAGSLSLGILPALALGQTFGWNAQVDDTTTFTEQTDDTSTWVEQTDDTETFTAQTDDVSTWTEQTDDTTTFTEQ